MSKSKPSRLDQFAEVLQTMDTEKKTLAEMQAWLAQENCKISTGALSNFLASLRSERLQAELLRQISTGARQVKEVEAQLATHPAPETDTLIKLVRVLIMKFSSQSNVTPEMSELVFNMLKPVIKWHEVQLKVGQLSLDREKFEFDAAKACLAKLPELQAISSKPKLSDEEKAKAIRQILFNLP